MKIREQIDSLREHKYQSWSQAMDEAADTLERLYAVYEALDEYQSRHGIVYADLNGGIDEAGKILRNAIIAVREIDQ